MTFNSFDISKFSEGVNQVDADSLDNILSYAYMCAESCPLFKENMEDNFEVPTRDMWADIYRCAYDRWAECYDESTLEPLSAYHEQLASREYDTIIMALNKGIWWKVWG
jgi:hypothetical protein